MSGGFSSFGSRRHASLCYQHQLGRCVVHRGHRRHGADDITEGERLNLILWTRGSFWHVAQKPKIRNPAGNHHRPSKNPKPPKPRMEKCAPEALDWDTQRLNLSFGDTGDTSWDETSKRKLPHTHRVFDSYLESAKIGALKWQRFLFCWWCLGPFHSNSEGQARGGTTPIWFGGGHQALNTDPVNKDSR